MWKTKMWQMWVPPLCPSSPFLGPETDAPSLLVHLPGTCLVLGAWTLAPLRSGSRQSTVPASGCPQWHSWERPSGQGSHSGLCAAEPAAGLCLCLSRGPRQPPRGWFPSGLGLTAASSAGHPLWGRATPLHCALGVGSRVSPTGER